MGEGLESLIAHSRGLELPGPCVTLLLALDEAISEAVASERSVGRRWRRALFGSRRRRSTPISGAQA